MAKIGFIGLGHMGLPMILNLMRTEHQITGYDISPTATTALTTAGGKLANNIAELAAQNDIVITMLQTGDQVKEVCCGNSGIYHSARPNTLHIDCSTIDVHTTQEINRLAYQQHLRAVDAPVSGGVTGAKAGTLTFLLGGETDACAAASPILNAMGKQVVLTGASGSGQAAKICNNMILGISMLAVSEGFLLAKRLGLSAQKLHEAVTHASGQCWVMERYVPVPDVLENVPANHDYQAGFSLNMMLKDLNFSQAAAQDCGLKTPIAELTTKIFQTAKDQGLGDFDFSAVIKLLEEGKS